MSCRTRRCAAFGRALGASIARGGRSPLGKAKAATLRAIRALVGEASRYAIRNRALEDGCFTRRELAAPATRAKAGQYERLVGLGRFVHPSHEEVDQPSKSATRGDRR